MNAKERRQRANTVLDILRGAEGQMDNMTMVSDSDGNNIPSDAKDHIQKVKGSLKDTIANLLIWIDFERVKME